MTTIDQIVSPQLDYASKVFNHPSPLYVKITPQSGTTSPVLSLNSVGSLSEFQIPAKCINLSNSYLSFNLNFPTGGTSNFTFLQANLGATINRIVLSTVGSNVVLADISNVGNYLEAVSSHSTKLSDILAKSSGAGLVFDTDATTSLTTCQRTPVEDIVRSNTANNYIGQIYTGTGGGDDTGVAYTSVKHLYTSASANTVTAISVRLPLSAFRNSIMAIDKDLYFAGETLNLAIYWEAVQKYAFIGTSASNPSTGQAVFPTVATMDSLALYVSCEQNIAITSGIVERVMKQGLTMPIPLVWSSKQAIATSTAHSITLNITRSHGNKLLFVAWAPYHTTETSNTCKAHTTYLHSTYQTLLNQVPILNNAGHDVTKGEHYYANKENLADSGIQNLISYNNNFTHFDNFTGMSLPSLGDNLTTYNGIDLTQETQQWQLNATTSSVSLNHYIFWICQKQLTIAPNAITLA
jgi:hypothetical protein